MKYLLLSIYSIFFNKSIKKLCLIFMIVLFIFSCKTISSSLIEGKQYIRLNKPIHNAPNLLEFFSFYCAHCYQFEQICNISDYITTTFPKNINFYRYHVNFLGNLGKQLTHAWAVAITLGIENKISSALFIAIQKQQSIHTVDDIRKIFIQFGVKEDEYDAAWNSILVKSLIVAQEKAVFDFHLIGVPSIFVNGKYMIKNDKLDLSSVNAYVKQFFELLNLLIQKN